jgi:hypothetical protein
MHEVSGAGPLCLANRRELRRALTVHAPHRGVDLSKVGQERRNATRIVVAAGVEVVDWLPASRRHAEFSPLGMTHRGSRPHRRNRRNARRFLESNHRLEIV